MILALDVNPVSDVVCGRLRDYRNGSRGQTLMNYCHQEDEYNKINSNCNYLNWVHDDSFLLMGSLLFEFIAIHR